MRETFFKRMIYLYIIIPVFIFIFGWLKWFIVIPVALGLGIGIAGVWKTIEEDSSKIPIKTLVVTFGVAMVWCIVSGQGGYYYQSDDYNARNAIFRDLILHSWPVTYPEENMGMIYYIGQWMIPAMFGKIFLHLFGEVVAWNVANFVLMLWSTLGITIVFILFYKVIGASTIKKKAIAIVGMIFFSGLDIVGIGLQCITNRRLILIDHIECWSTVAEFSSITTCLLWVFNQSIVPWIIILLYLSKETKRNYAFLGITCTLYGPLPALGLLPFMLGSAFYEFIECKNERKQIVSDTFSVQNILVTVLLLPIMLVYYRGNYTWSSSTISQLTNSSWGGLKTILVLVAFVILEFGLYAFMLYKFYRRDINYYILVITLLAALMFQLGSASDFSRRVSIPSLFVLMSMVVKIFINVTQSTVDRVSRWCCLGLIVFFAIGTITPLVEYGRGIVNIVTEKKVCLVKDEMKTLEGKERIYTGNFVTYELDSNVFFKYLGK